MQDKILEFFKDKEGGRFLSVNSFQMDHMDLELWGGVIIGDGEDFINTKKIYSDQANVNIIEANLIDDYTDPRFLIEKDGVWTKPIQMDLVYLQFGSQFDFICIDTDNFDLIYGVDLEPAELICIPNTHKDKIEQLKEVYILKEYASDDKFVLLVKDKPEPTGDAIQVKVKRCQE